MVRDPDSSAPSNPWRGDAYHGSKRRNWQCPVVDVASVATQNSCGSLQSPTRAHGSPTAVEAGSQAGGSAGTGAALAQPTIAASVLAHMIERHHSLIARERPQHVWHPFLRVAPSSARRRALAVDSGSQAGCSRALASTTWRRCPRGASLFRTYTRLRSVEVTL